MEASKWLDIPLLISAEEMERLFKTLEKFQIFMTGRVVPTNGGEVTNFLDVYRRYVETLKKGQLPDETEYRSVFASVWTVTPDVVNVTNFDANRQLLRLEKPAVQLQPHSMIFSEQDGKFYSMVYGRDSILWGIQFSYPQLYLHPQTKDVMKVDENFPNTSLFRSIQRWVRHETVPTPMKTPKGSLNIPVRLGKECLSWINQHPQLKSHHLVCEK